jgi:hypothetical protein
MGPAHLDLGTNYDDLMNGTRVGQCNGAGLGDSGKELPQDD